MEEDKRKSANDAKVTADKAPGGEGASPEGQLAAQIADMAQEAAKAAGDIQSLQAENTEMKDKNLRLVAEMENLRRRIERRGILLKIRVLGDAGREEPAGTTPERPDNTA